MDPTRDAYKQKMEAQLAEWAAKLDVFKARADGIRAEARIQLLSEAEELKTLELAAREKIREVESAADEKWQELRSGIDQRWDQLSGSIEALWARLSSKLVPDSASAR
jgi:hypothetical protein